MIFVSTQKGKHERNEVAKKRDGEELDFQAIQKDDKLIERLLEGKGGSGDGSVDDRLSTMLGSWMDVIDNPEG